MEHGCYKLNWVEQMKNGLNDFPRDDLERVLRELKKQLGISLHLRGNKIAVTINEHTVSLDIIPISSLSANNVGSSIKYCAGLGPGHIIFTPSVSKEILRKMRDAGISIIDLTGKIFIKSKNVYIFDDKRLFPARKTRKSYSLAFNEAGIKIIFACLCLPELIEQDYRTIANLSGTSLGSVSRVLDNLKRTGYLLKKNDQTRILVKKIELLDRWCIAYAEVLRPKLLVGRYMCEDPYWWRDVNIGEYNAVWGGEIAGAILTKNLKPQIVTIYTNASLAKLQIAKTLRTDRRGEIEVLKQFWGFQNPDGFDNIAPYILIYADLISTGDERNDEIAGEIKNQFIAEKLK